jgi:hypothetical protein
MKKKCLILLSSALFINSAYAGRITTNPNTGQSDKIISTSIKHAEITKYRVFVKTSLETFVISADTYADASALVGDLKKDSVVYCKMASRLRVDTVSNCKFVEMRFDD